MGELGYTERRERASVMRTNKNKASIILCHHYSAASENSCPVGNFRRLFSSMSWSLRNVHSSKPMVYI